jgi:hypothetical protein
MICCKIAAEQIFDQSTQGNICARRLGATLYFFFFSCVLCPRVKRREKRNLKQLSATWVDKLVVSTGRDMREKEEDVVGAGVAVVKCHKRREREQLLD